MIFTVRAANWHNDKAALQQIRKIVFIEEQKVPIELEWDDRDEDAYHWLALDEKNNPIGSCRLFKDGHLTRMAVLGPHRSNGVGEALLKAVLNQAKANNLFEISLSSQVHALSFYEKAGFVAYGPEYMDANIPHRSMRLQLLVSRLLGHHGGDFAVSNLKKTAQELIKQVSKQLRILSYDLDTKIFDNHEMVESISSLARHSRYTNIQILVVDSSKIVSRGHRLINLQRRLSSNILLRKATTLPHEIKNNLIIADQTGTICQSIKEPKKIWANYNNHPITQNYISQFDDLWQRAQEDNNLRQLEL
jgi:predicted GNAT family N-acyltransferase